MVFRAQRNAANCSARPFAPGQAFSVGLFFFFSNQLGCLGSILVSVVLTLVFLVLVGAILRTKQKG